MFKVKKVTHLKLCKCHPVTLCGRDDHDGWAGNFSWYDHAELVARGKTICRKCSNALIGEFVIFRRETKESLDG